MKPRHLVVLAAGLALGVTALAVVHGTPASSLAGASAGATVALAAVGWALIACGVVAWARRPASRFGPLLAAAGGAWFVAELNNPGAGSSLLFTVGLLGYAACPAIVAHAALAYPEGRVPGRLARAALAVAYAGTLLALGLLPALTFEPAAQGCIDCPDNLLAVTSAPDVVEAAGRAGLVLGLVWAPRARGAGARRGRPLLPRRAAAARAGAGCRPPPTSRWSPPTTPTASRAASSPTTPSTTACGSRRRRRSRCSRSGSHGRGCASGGRARASRGS